MRKDTGSFVHRSLVGWLFATAGLLILCGPMRPHLARAASPSPQGLVGSTLIRQVPYAPTPEDVVVKMLDLAKVTPDDVVYDLGSGDGRVVITAAQKYKAHAVGIEIDPALYLRSSKHIEELGLQDRARIIHEDMFNVDIHRATVVVLYLLTSFNEKLRPKLQRELRSGTRIVSHDFHIPGWEPDKVVEVTSEYGISHKLYLYVHP